MTNITEEIKSGKEVLWLNPNYNNTFSSSFQFEDIIDAEHRLQRFAPVIKQLFPETATSNGIIESPLREIDDFKDFINEKYSVNLPSLFIKLDSELPIAGSVKARGGIYEVLKHTEDLALQNHIIENYQDDYYKILRNNDFFFQHTIQVGSTGNLGLSIGIMSAALGYHAIVHMSSDAKQWKKDLLRSKGVTVKEYPYDYSKAVKEGRKLSKSDPSSYFVDDENSKDLFLGYATSALRLKKQFQQRNIVVDENHPLFVYLPCGVGGAPGGITFGLKQLFKNNVHCFFVEPTQACCMLVGLITGKHNQISVTDYGLSGKTEADGLAVSCPSKLVSTEMDTLLSGEFTVSDDKLISLLKSLYQKEQIFIEPSSCAALYPLMLINHPVFQQYLKQNSIIWENSTHIVWSTGGCMVPEDIKKSLIG